MTDRALAEMLAELDNDQKAEILHEIIETIDDERIRYMIKARVEDKAKTLFDE